MTKPQRYDINYLTQYCSDNSIVLLEQYTNTNRSTKIKGNCIHCPKTFDKSFRAMVEMGALCKECAIKNGVEKTKKIFIKNYGCEHPLQNKEIMEKVKKTNIEKYGCENPFQNEEIKQRIKDSNMEKYGVEYTLQVKEIREKGKKTNLEKYGCENPFQNEEIKQRIKDSNMEKYGVEHTLQVKEFREKGKITMIEKYGGDCPAHSKQLREKAEETNIEKYGCRNPFQSEKCKQKIRETNMEKYGVEYPNQNPIIMDKNSKKLFRIKTYTLPSGKDIHYQGYEHFAFNDLLKEITEDDLVNGTKNVPEIWYEDTEGKRHRHYVDIFIPSQNKCIEVKSTWTLNLKKDNIFEKQKYAKEQGYNYEIWVYNKDGERVECFS